MGTKKQTTEPNLIPGVSVVDLFCGIGGLSHGFLQENFRINAGIDLDGTCRFIFEANNAAPFLHKDISEIAEEELKSLYPKKDVKILVGCAPCQPFSSYAFKHKDEGSKWKLLYEFARLIREVQPEIVSMENVPQLLNFKRGPVIKDFVAALEESGYHVSYQVVYSPDYGIPQTRKRLVLLASRLGPITFVSPTHGSKSYVTVRDVIGHLPPVNQGEASPLDALHKASGLSDLNLTRIRQSVPGGNWNDWDEDLVLDCHRKKTGKTYSGVYGRMKWDEPAPTITTQFFGLGSGRFGHPEQDRALTLREGALLQTFPQNYAFVESEGASLAPARIGKHIGNAVPVRLARMIAVSVKVHLAEHGVIHKKYAYGKVSL